MSSEQTMLYNKSCFEYGLKAFVGGNRCLLGFQQNYVNIPVCSQVVPETACLDCVVENSDPETQSHIYKHKHKYKSRHRMLTDVLNHIYFA